MHPGGTKIGALVLAWAAGAVEALLIARLIARLLAARPDSPSVQILYGMTAPLVTPLGALNYDQPPFGAAFELSTLVLALILPLGAYLLWALLVGRNSATAGGV